MIQYVVIVIVVLSLILIIISLAFTVSIDNKSKEDSPLIAPEIEEPLIQTNIISHHEMSSGVDRAMDVIAKDIFKNVVHLSEFSLEFVYVFELEEHMYVLLIPSYHFVAELIATNLQLAKEWVKERNGTCCTILIDGEPNDSIAEVDAIITSKQSNTAHAVFLPYFSMFAKEFVRVTGHLRHSRRVDLTEWHKRQFCFFGHGNDSIIAFDGTKNRGIFYRLMCERFGDHVRNLGRTQHTLGEHPTHRKLIDSSTKLGKNKFILGTNNHLLRHFKFAICFENQEIEGYFTEKLLNPLEVQCIPIYCGAPDIRTWINPDCFINVNDYTSMHTCIDDIGTLINDDQRLQLLLTSPCFSTQFMNGTPGTYLDNRGLFYSKLFDILPVSIRNHVQITKALQKQVMAITFADGVHSNYDRIQKEMTTCGYFDHAQCFSTFDLSQSFLTNWLPFMKENKKGFGYYIWKSFIIKNALESLADGEILVWLDAGMHIKPYQGSFVLDKYYQRLIKSEHDILAFRIKYAEHVWTKRDLFELIQQRYPHFKPGVTDRQLCTGVLMLQKSANSIKFVNEWFEIATMDNARYSTSAPSLSGQEHIDFNDHRHDQSIFSMLAKVYGAVISDDNFTDSVESDDMVFQPRRWRLQ